MSDRKYRQRGYQDEPRPERSPQKPAGAPRPQEPRGQSHLRPKSPSMPGFREVVKCVRCGQIVSGAIGLLDSCGRCKADLHSCAQCVSFSPGHRFECTENIPARIAPKDARNACDLFSPRTTVERETGSTRPNDARSAFDDLFK
jgi:hypothetical protein